MSQIAKSSYALSFAHAFDREKDDGTSLHGANRKTKEPSFIVKIGQAPAARVDSPAALAHLLTAAGLLNLQMGSLRHPMDNLVSSKTEQRKLEQINKEATKNFTAPFELEKFPEDIHVEIASYLPRVDLQRLRASCRTFAISHRLKMMHHSQLDKIEIKDIFFNPYGTSDIAPLRAINKEQLPKNPSDRAHTIYFSKSKSSVTRLDIYSDRVRKIDLYNSYSGWQLTDQSLPNPRGTWLDKKQLEPQPLTEASDAEQS